MTECKICMKKLLKQNLNDHNFQEHSGKKCEYCDALFDGDYMLSLHSCQLKPRQCAYCEVFLPYAQHLIHEEECSNRTEQCPNCRFLIRRRFYIEHITNLNCSSVGLEVIPAEVLLIEARKYNKLARTQKQL